MILARNISVTLGDREILRDVSLAVGSGETLALIGPNGAGKTTLLRSLNATVTTSRGDVIIGDRNIADMSRREIARTIAVVAQENETKFPVTVLEFVLSGRFARGTAFGWETPDDLGAAEKALAECDLVSLSSRLMNELSGGERQRVVLARALAAEAKVLLLDEPTANLDLAHQSLMFRLVRERCRDAGVSAVVITHDLNLASEFADQVALLQSGTLIASGPPESVLTRENLAKVYGVDVLLDANPSSGKVRVTMVY